jgi:hypothetical protein
VFCVGWECTLRGAVSGREGLVVWVLAPPSCLFESMHRQLGACINATYKPGHVVALQPLVMHLQKHAQGTHGRLAATLVNRCAQASVSGDTRWNCSVTRVRVPLVPFFALDWHGTVTE